MRGDGKCGPIGVVPDKAVEDETVVDKAVEDETVVDKAVEDEIVDGASV